MNQHDDDRWMELLRERTDDEIRKEVERQRAQSGTEPQPVVPEVLHIPR